MWTTGQKVKWQNDGLTDRRTDRQTQCLERGIGNLEISPKTTKNKKEEKTTAKKAPY